MVDCVFDNCCVCDEIDFELLLFIDYVEECMCMLCGVVVIELMCGVIY